MDTTKVLDKAYIQDLLSKNDRAVIQALLAIYARQTEAEKATLTTKEDNGVGFNGIDGTILTSFAQWYQQKGFLSPKQLAISRNKMKHYWKQLLCVAEGKGYTVSYTVKKVKKNATVSG